MQSNSQHIKTRNTHAAPPREHSCAGLRGCGLCGGGTGDLSSAAAGEAAWEKEGALCPVWKCDHSGARYNFSSCLHRRLGRGVRVGLGVGQLGPDVLPVVGAQVLAGDGALGGAFYGNAALDGDGALASRPLPHQLRRRADQSCQFRLTHFSGIDEGLELHAPIISASLKLSQAFRIFFNISAALVIEA